MKGVGNVNISTELAQRNVSEARVRLELLRAFVRGSRLSVEAATEAQVAELLAALEGYVRQQEDHWEYLLREEDRREALALASTSPPQTS